MAQHPYTISAKKVERLVVSVAYKGVTYILKGHLFAYTTEQGRTYYIVGDELFSTLLAAKEAYLASLAHSKGTSVQQYLESLPHG